MEAGLYREYRRFRANDARLSASNALYMARTIREWEELEAEGLVKLTAEWDEDPYDFGDCLEGLSEESASRYKERVYNLGVFGVVGSYLCPIPSGDAPDMTTCFPRSKTTTCRILWHRPSKPTKTRKESKCGRLYGADSPIRNPWTKNHPVSLTGRGIAQ